MEKRKLSAVPTEKATNDMVDAAKAEMLKQKMQRKKYFVTATLLNELNVLALNIWHVSDLASGIITPKFRVFCSHDDYITQDLSENDYKWRTGAIDYLGIYAYESNWNSKNKQYDRFFGVLFCRQGDLNLISNFLTEEYGLSDEETWKRISGFQDRVKEARLAEKHRKELVSTDLAMEPIKGVPDEFFEWSWETGMGHARYLIYKEVKSGIAECECTYCGKSGMVKRKDIRMRNNEKGNCPFCNSKVTFKPKGKLPSYLRDERWIIFVEPYDDDGIVLRHFMFRQTIHGDRFIQQFRSGNTEGRIERYCQECNRTIMTFPSGKIVNQKEYEWNTYKSGKTMRWCPADNGVHYRCGETLLYPNNLPHAWEHTPLKYSAFEILSRNVETIPIDYEAGIKAYMDFNKLEWFIKMGLNNLTIDLIHHRTRYYHLLGKINTNGETIYDILGLDKERVRILQEIDGDNKVLRLLQVAKGIGLRVKPDQLKKFYETFECNTDLLKKCGEKVTMHKLVKYISKESENYPLHSKQRTFRYGYFCCEYGGDKMDPRIERKQNMARDWLEYLGWCRELHYDIDNLFIYMPNNFKKVHDRTAKEYQEHLDRKAMEEKRRREKKVAQQMKEIKKNMEEIFKMNDGVDAFSIKGKGLVLVVPASAQEIKAEGEALHHCVGSYVEKVAKGITQIFFVRKAKEPDKPYFTMEWKDGKVVQCRGLRNCGMPTEVKAFVSAFEKIMNEREEGNGKRKKKQDLQPA